MSKVDFPQSTDPHFVMELHARSQKSSVLFQGRSLLNMQLIHYAWITFPLCLHNVFIACSTPTIFHSVCRQVLGKSLTRFAYSVKKLCVPEARQILE